MTDDVSLLEFEESNVGVFLRIQTLLVTSIRLRTYFELVPVDVLSYILIGNAPRSHEFLNISLLIDEVRTRIESLVL